MYFFFIFRCFVLAIIFYGKKLMWVVAIFRSNWLKKDTFCGSPMFRWNQTKKTLQAWSRQIKVTKKNKVNKFKYYGQQEAFFCFFWEKKKLILCPGQQKIAKRHFNVQKRLFCFLSIWAIFILHLLEKVLVWEGETVFCPTIHRALRG